MPAPQDHPVIALSLRYKEMLNSRSILAINAERESYLRIMRSVNGKIVQIQSDLERLQANGQLTVGKVADLQSLLELQSQVIAQLAKYTKESSERSKDLVNQETALALQESKTVVQGYFPTRTGQALLEANWRNLSPEAVSTMRAFTVTGGYLDRKWQRLGPGVSGRMANTLIEAVGLGYNPRKTAQLLRQDLGVGLNWALTTTRTTQLWAYREATRQNYANNTDVVGGWIWFAQLDKAVCLSCVAQHGTKHTVNEVLNDHHNGRCVQIPDVPLLGRLGIPLPEIQKGEEWFNGLAPSDQKSRMGPGMYEAWKAKEFKFGQLSVPYSDEAYGVMLRQATLGNLRGDSPTPIVITPPTPTPTPSTLIVPPTHPKAITVDPQAVELKPAPKSLPTPAQAREIFLRESRAIEELRDKNLDLSLEMGRLRAELVQTPTLTPQERSQKEKLVEQMLAQHQATKEEIRSRSSKALELPEDLRGKVTVTYGTDAEKRLKAETKSKIEESRDWLQRMSVHDLRYSVRVDTSGRAFYADNAIYVSNKSNGLTFIHEAGHALEESRGPAAWKQRHDFFESRTQGDPIEKLSVMTGNNSYRSNEVGKRDAWSDAYIGKMYYPQGVVGTHSEIISMGIERMWYDAANFARKDPEYFDFILGYLRGQ